MMKQAVLSEVEVPKKSLISKDLLFKMGALIGLIVLSIVLSILSPYFLTIDNLANIASQVSINAFISLGMMLTILTAGIDLSVGSMLALSICMMGIVNVKWGWNPYLSIVIGLALGALFGAINGLLLTKLHLPHPFISTIGTMYAFQGIALIITATMPITGFAHSVQFLGAGKIGVLPVSFIALIIVSVIFHVFLNRTRMGRYIYSVGGNPEASRLAGINVDRVLIFVYTASGFMAALAGLVLVGQVNSAYPLAGSTASMDAIAAVIIGGASFFGGVGTVGGTLIGALLIAVLRNGLNLLNVSSDSQTIVIGVVIIAAVAIDVIRQKRMKRGN